MERERRTIEAMIRLYCERVHSTNNGLCAECDDLRAFAELRLSKCPFQEEKPTCASCPIHCYKPDRREQIRAVMRYSGPRMMLKHPILAVRHMLDGRRETSELNKRK
jgi:predicted amidophosphoribosyltransferase